jgi:hypothetical protein
MLKADFSSMGSAAYPGRLIETWGAQLVRPPAIKPLLASASSKLKRMGEIAPVRSGVPTRAVKFFCIKEVTDDDQSGVLAEHGIRTRTDRGRLALVIDGRDAYHVIERVSLKPLIRRPAAIKAKAIVDESATEGWHLFYATEDRPELQRLRLTHTLDYVDYGEMTEFRGPQGSRRQGGVPSQRAQIEVRSVWWRLTAIDESEGRVAFQKGRDDTHFVAVLPRGIWVPDNFLYSIPPPSLPHPQLLGAIANLTWTHLMCEVHGRRAAGDGVLQTYVRDLNSMPIPDPHQFSQGEAEELVGLFGDACSRPSLPIGTELQQTDRQAFDRFAMTWLFGAEAAESALSVVERSIRDLVIERQVKKATGQVQRRRVARTGTFDPAPVAAQILEQVGQPPSIQVNIANRLGDLDGLVVEIPAHAVGVVTVGETLLDHTVVQIDGSPLIQAEDSEHARLLAALLGRTSNLTGPVELPASATQCEEVLAQWEENFAQWRAAVEKLLLTLLPSSVHASRRERVRKSIEELAVLAPGEASGR